MADLKKLLEQLLQLPEEARAALAAQLLESLESDIDEQAEAQWSQEIASRLHELDSGTVKGVPWSEARRAILGADDEPAHR